MFEGRRYHNAAVETSAIHTSSVRKIEPDAALVCKVTQGFYPRLFQPTLPATSNQADITDIISEVSTDTFEDTSDFSINIRVAEISAS